jgi:hypothetical protein
MIARPAPELQASGAALEAVSAAIAGKRLHALPLGHREPAIVPLNNGSLAQGMYARLKERPLDNQLLDRLIVDGAPQMEIHCAFVCHCEFLLVVFT